MTQMQGIVTILRSEKMTEASPLRRTLSADMSSKTWLGLPMMKKMASSEQIAMESDDEEEEECEVGDKNPSRMDIWSAIMSQKKQDDDSGTPYVHPLVKKSARSLSDKSLKVCTESLGSETGSDVFMLNNPGEAEHNKAVKHSSSTTKKEAARCFPPPLPSLAAAHTDGPSLHMHSRRVEGRLVLEAVSVPPQKYFQAQRQDGRFLLTLINQQPFFNINSELQEKTINQDDDEKIEPPLTDLNKSTITIKKIANRKLNKNITTTKLQLVTDHIDQLQEQIRTIKGRPPLPRPPTATSVNSYHYFWRSKQGVINPTITQHRPPTKTKDLLLLRKADCLIPSLIGCKDPRKSLVMWEPFCIATS